MVIAYVVLELLQSWKLAQKEADFCYFLHQQMRFSIA